MFIFYCDFGVVCVKYCSLPDVRVLTYSNNACCVQIVSHSLLCVICFVVCVFACVFCKHMICTVYDAHLLGCVRCAIWLGCIISGL